MTNLPIMEHIVRYGIAADQEYISDDLLNTYDHLVINANMVAHMPGGLASFLSDKAFGKQFFIDPQTHVFQFDITDLQSSSEKTDEKGRPVLKRSIKNLIDSYGEPLQSVVAKNYESILPEDFTKAKSDPEAFCANVLKFQHSQISDAAETKDSAKYIKYAARQRDSKVTDWKPSIKVAPYFYITPRTVDEWLDVNIDFGNIARGLTPDGLLAVQIVTSQDILTDEGYRNTVIDRYTALQPDVFMLWIDKFSEHDSPESSLMAYIDLIDRLGERAPVVNPYGGYFSIALLKCKIAKKLIGVAHGIGYGEDRGVLPVSGGIPFAKFYFPILHKRVLFRDAVRVARALGGFEDTEGYFNNVCNCTECQAVIREDPERDFEKYGETKPVGFMRTLTPIVIDFPIPETKRHCTRHFMLSKKREHDAAMTPEKLLEELKVGKRLERTLGLDSVSHCSVWENVINSL